MNDFIKPGETIYLVRKLENVPTCQVCLGEGILWRRNRDTVKCPSCGSARFEIIEDKVSYVVETRVDDGECFTYRCEYNLEEHNAERFFSYCPSHIVAESVVASGRPWSNTQKTSRGECRSDCDDPVYVIEKADDCKCKFEGPYQLRPNTYIVVKRRVVQAVGVMHYFTEHRTNFSFKLLLDDGKWYSMDSADPEKHWFRTREEADRQLSDLIDKKRNRTITVNDMI